MAVLTSNDFKAFKRAIRGDPAVKAEVLSLGISRQTWMSGMQALEDGYSGERAAFKAAMEAALGISVTNSLAVAFEKMWMQNKARGL